MARLTPTLRHRVQIRTPIQTANDDNGGYDLEYTTIATLWMGMKVSRFQGRGAEYVDNEQVNTSVTHNFKVRNIELSSIGRAFSPAFSNGFDSVVDLFALKTDYFLFLEKGSATKGRSFRIHSVTNDHERDHFFNIGAEEIETVGTGGPA